MPKYHFTYSDNSKSPSIIIFEVDGDLLSEVDLIFQKTTGIDVIKSKHIGVQVRTNEQIEEE